jgi:hypothetical protein
VDLVVVPENRSFLILLQVQVLSQADLEAVDNVFVSVTRMMTIGGTR